MKKKKNKFPHFKHLEKIFRFRGISNTRFNKIRLDANERVTGFDKKFLNVIKKKITSDYLIAYPEIEKLYDLFAKKFNLQRNNFLITSGSDIGIRHCFELIVKPNKKIITINPTFGMVDVYSKLFMAQQIKIGFDNKLKLDLKKMLNSINKKVSMIIFANPNSPTGTIINEKDIIEILKKAKKNNCYVVIDEAYHGFYKKSVIKLIKKFNNLIVLRTFSKAYGLAGCRVGLVISNKYITNQLYKFRPMYEINSISVLIIREIIKNDKIINKYVRETNLGKKFLIENLKNMDLNYYPTYTNFILVNFKNKKNQMKTFQFLNNNKILTRNAPNIRACNHHLRFTLGPTKIMKKLVNNLKKVELG